MLGANIGVLMSVLSLVLVSTLSLPGMFAAANGLLVRQDGPSGFSVPYRGLSGPTDFWCAAGDFAIRALGQRSDALIYRTSALPRASGAGMTFSLDPQASVGKTGLLLLGGTGDGITAALAQSFCAKQPK